MVVHQCSRPSPGHFRDTSEHGDASTRAFGQARRPNQPTEAGTSEEASFRQNRAGRELGLSPKSHSRNLGRPASGRQGLQLDESAELTISKRQTEVMS